MKGSAPRKPLANLGPVLPQLDSLRSQPRQPVTPDPGAGVSPLADLPPGPASVPKPRLCWNQLPVPTHTRTHTTIPFAHARTPSILCSHTHSHRNIPPSAHTHTHMCTHTHTGNTYPSIQTDTHTYNIYIHTQNMLPLTTHRGNTHSDTHTETGYPSVRSDTFTQKRTRILPFTQTHDTTSIHASTGHPFFHLHTHTESHYIQIHTRHPSFHS